MNKAWNQVCARPLSELHGFYTTDTKENYYLDNSAVASQGGAGIRAAKLKIGN